MPTWFWRLLPGAAENKRWRQGSPAGDEPRQSGGAPARKRNGLRRHCGR
ncbi:MAG TPA: hypothetical protein PLF52_09255 [Syntrophales bacterium]|nr:hypothetical protein [Syntrophales bacterium]HQK78528.1 hypothetical protein [Syntrophales bacterium]